MKKIICITLLLLNLFIANTRCMNKKRKGTALTQSNKNAKRTKHTSSYSQKRSHAIDDIKSVLNLDDTASQLDALCIAYKKLQDLQDLKEKDKTLKQEKFTALINLRVSGQQKEALKQENQSLKSKNQDLSLQLEAMEEQKKMFEIENKELNDIIDLLEANQHGNSLSMDINFFNSK